ncbi:MAG: hypothetical protein SCARUB_00194 [Candidatus Scalindua rubra]|uniref:Uncharacterized protein n=1 Tax=Candidatus Scalindua rubra TaxID=1872076 RepID=A0A1E3XI72_9BACT|nr:MAG: hypothetical protein SCARUB_00194 [Candidatus Scalindua rubra]
MKRVNVDDRSNLYCLIIIAFILVVVLVPQSISQKCEAETTKTAQKEIIEIANEILANRRCSCQCNNYLPGSSKIPACFGCSAGKAEITYVLESLKAGKKAREIVLNLNSPILIDVFADYTNANISKVWKLVKTVSDELHQNRVVLRTPGLTAEARRAIKLAEYARLSGNFCKIQEALIDHNGPWDWDTLIKLAAQHDMDTEQIRAYADEINIDAQIVKDQEHAKERGIDTYPTTTINNHITSNTDTAIRQAIEKILLEHSI